jgi:Flp pilus assembly protein TadG
VQRLSIQQDPERGGVAVIVALLIVVLLGFTAIAVDVGSLYSEQAQLQNGADSAALAVAQKCAKSSTDANCSTSSTLAATVNSANALDGQSNIKSMTLDKTNRTVTVTSGAQEQGREPNTVSLFFARALGISTSEVNATSSVTWGSPVAGTTPFPLTISLCQVSGLVDGATQLLQNHSDNLNLDCPLGPAGQIIPGGFGWIVQDAGVCGGSVDINLNEGGSAPGNSGPANCNAILTKWQTELTAGRQVVVLLPVYQSVTGTGAGASYDLIAFAAMNIKGWKFAGAGDALMNFRNTVTDAGTSACIGDCRGIIGSFIKYVSLSEGYTLGPVDPYGAAVVKFTG